jgi:NAD(P)H-flavin reductase
MLKKKASRIKKAGDAKQLIMDGKKGESNKMAQLRRSLHVHSRLARVKLHGMAVGQLSKRAVPVSRWLPKGLPSKFSNPGLHVHQYKLLPLSEKRLLLPPEARHPVYYLRFEFHEPDDHILFIPGEFVVLQIATTGGFVYSRPYVPIICHAKGYLDLIVKSYPGGKITEYLAEMQPGDTITVRGPLPCAQILNDQCDFGLFGTIFFYCRCMLYHYDIRLTCEWLLEKIGIFVGGTGLSVALLLIDYYLKFSKRDSQNKPLFRVALCFANHSEIDIFYRQELEELVRPVYFCDSNQFQSIFRCLACELTCVFIFQVAKSNGAISIHYCIKQPTPSWRGYVGTITVELVHKILSPLQESNNDITVANASYTHTLTGEELILPSPYEMNGVKIQRSEVILEGNEKPSTMPRIPVISLNSSEAPLINIDDDNKSMSDSISNVGDSAPPVFTPAPQSLPSTIKGNNKLSIDRAEKPLQLLVCGPEAFNLSVSDTLKEAGFQEKQITVLPA